MISELSKEMNKHSNRLVKIKPHSVKNTVMRDPRLFAQLLMFSLLPHLAPVDKQQTSRLKKSLITQIKENADN